MQRSAVGDHDCRLFLEVMVAKPFQIIPRTSNTNGSSKLESTCDAGHSYDPSVAQNHVASE